MSELALNGTHSSEHNHIDNETHNDLLPTTELDDANDALASSPIVNSDSNDQSEGPPLKRRKVAADDSHKSSPRAPSPPWKKITADGPTTFIDNGRRRSGRTNVIPLEQQPNSGKRQTRAAYDKLADRRAKPAYNADKKSKQEAQGSKAVVNDKPRRGPGRPPKIRVEENVKPVLQPISPQMNRRTSTRLERSQLPPQQRNGVTRSVAVIDDEIEEKLRSPSPPLTLQKVRFRVALPKPSVLSPANAPPPKKYADFREFWEKDPLEPYVGQNLLTPMQIRREALVRQRLYESQQSGEQIGASTVNVLPDKQLDLRKEFAHRDHLLGHIAYFRTLLAQEQKEHRRRAEQLAHEAKRYLEEKRKKGRVKTAEELAREYTERMRVRYRHVVKDIDKLWLGVRTEINAMRQRQFEEEQQARIKSHLNRVLERTDEMLTRREDSIMTSDVESETDLPTDDDEESGASDSEVMSNSSSDTESDSIHNDSDEELTAEQLRAKYESLPDLEKSEEVGPDDAALGSDAEDSDPDIEMDSELDSGESDDEDEEDEESDGEAEAGGLLSLLFSKKEVAAMKAEDPQDNNMVPLVAEEDNTVYQNQMELDTPSIVDHEQYTPSQVVPQESEIKKVKEVVNRLDDNPNNRKISAANEDVQTLRAQEASVNDGHSPLTVRVADDMDIDKQPQNSPGLPAPAHVIEDMTSQDMSLRTSPGTSATKQSEPDSASSPEPQPDPVITTPDHKTDTRTPVPSLLRGTLREYQHEGLDWLAHLYANGRSGILADEMGLGKTIQSIALLAHLATEYEVWGPHLIVVPTSVMLNWEMEFKKFLPGFKILTYYGTLEERKQKRRGWMADDSFNVCITSYQLVLQDANSFKRRRWHYMILDEAHNIKNFRSERWQTMMTFNTRARLLLTGTPLQNNLTELWSLLFFLHYGQEGQDEDEAFAGLKEWSEWFKRPVESILEHGRQVLDEEDKEQVAKLHKVIRPFLLRRLKADVEKQMPAKYEHVEMCRLSKRQRQLYDGFMSRAQTKETLASGNYLSIINALMQLRKVCNHPDLFETRPINTSFAMSKPIAAQFEIQDLLVRRKLFGGNPLDEVDLDFLQLVPISNEKISLIENLETVRKHAYHPFKALRDSQWSRINRNSVQTGMTRVNVLASLETVGRQARLQDIDRTMYYEAYRHHQRPIYGRGLLEKLNLKTRYEQLSRLSMQREMAKSWETQAPITSLGLVQSVEDRSRALEPFVQHYACITPAVIANDFSTTLVTELGVKAIREDMAGRNDPFHQARMKLSIAFPDKRLLQYDCGKLQRLDKLLRELQAGGHRALIFTQMTKVLDILEQFLNIHGHRYLRLDGATKIEQRQILTDRFNNDNRILCFILSSRSGGLGINLTGADSVIFYDLDWNPAMDRQCTDRAHRIGQTRDVHIYRFVSEHTIESNILRKANQKQLLDDVVIQEGDFTTDYMNKLTYRDMLDEQAEDDVAGAAMDRVLGNDKGAVAAFEEAEDQEDVSAAKVAAKEVQHADDGDFEDKATATPRTGEPSTPGPYGATHAAIEETATVGVHHIDDYLLKLQTFLLKDVPLAPPKDKSKRGRKRGDEHRKRRAR